MTDTHAINRTQEHARLLRYADRQAVAFLQRDDSDALSIIVQLWCARDDHQLRVAIGVDGCPDSVIEDAFGDMDDEVLALTLDGLGVAQIIKDLEAA